MAKRENVLEKLIGKTKRPEGELEAIDRRLHENTARCFDEVLSLLLDNTGEYTKALLGGGRGSMKSSTASLGISAGLEHDEDACALVLRKVGDTLRGSVFEQMQWAIDVLGLGDHWRVTVSPMEIVNERTGQKIVFKGLDKSKKIKSIKLPFGKYFKYVWFEELDEFAGEGEIENVLDSAIRGGKAALCVCTYNPPKSANNWVNKWAIDPGKSVFVHHSDYTMVPAAWLGPTFLKRAEELKVRNPRAYEHTYLGIATGEGGALVERYPDGDDHSIDAVAYGNREHIYRSRRTSNVSGKGARR